MSKAEIMKTSGTLTIAGSETTATLLSGVTFHLLDNPTMLKRLAEEVRGKFSSVDDMSFVSLAQLSYLNACLQEALRIYPPIPGNLPRRTLPEGAMIAGHFIPGNVSRYLPAFINEILDAVEEVDLVMTDIRWGSSVECHPLKSQLQGP